MEEHADVSGAMDRGIAMGVHRSPQKPKVSWVERALENLIVAATNEGVTRVSLPRLGGGKIGLDWSRVKRILVEHGATTPIELVVFERFVRHPTEQVQPTAETLPVDEGGPRE